MTAQGGADPRAVAAADWRRVNHERAQYASGARWPTQDVLDLWKAHGGEWHGPRVETVTMPMYLLSAFLDAHAAQALASAEAARDEAVRRAEELEKRVGELEANEARLRRIAQPEPTGTYVRIYAVDWEQACADERRAARVLIPGAAT